METHTVPPTAAQLPVCRDCGEPLALLRLPTYFEELCSDCDAARCEEISRDAEADARGGYAPYHGRR